MKYHSTTSKGISFYGQAIKATRNVIRDLGYMYVTGVDGIRRLVFIQARRLSARTPLQEIWGKWPGGESIDEILEALRNLD